MPTTVAIIDDSPAIRKLIRSFIESHTDWEVCGEAGDGESAIALAKLLSPDLIVIDLAMPVKNGLDAARTIATDCPNSEMVLFTAHATKELAIEANRVGIKAVVSKDGNGLVELVAILRDATRKPDAA